MSWINPKATPYTIPYFSVNKKENTITRTKIILGTTPKIEKYRNIVVCITKLKKNVRNAYM